MIQYSEKQLQLISSPFNHTLDWLEGTPRSGKTTAGIHRYARNLITSHDENHLVTAYSAEQAYRLIMEGDGLGLMHVFKGRCHTAHDDSGAHLVVNINGSTKKIYWKGGGKADSYKSIQGMSLGSVYFCELPLLHNDMVQECLRRTWAAHDRWHIADMNPPTPHHPCITQVLDIQDCNYTHWTCADNPRLTPQRLKEIEEACSKSPFLYKRDWLGIRTIPEGVIYWMFDEQKMILNKVPNDVDPVEMLFFGDGGTTDATSIGCYIVGRNNKGRHMLFRVGNWYYDGGQKAMSTQAKEICGTFIPYMRSKYGMREEDIFIDPACKALRLEFEKLGYDTRRADNNSRDIKGNTKGLKCGIEMLQSGIADGRFFLVDDDKYDVTPWLKEVGLYCVDQHGNPVDAYNHAMDETRYAYNYFAKNYDELWAGGIVTGGSLI